MRACVVLRDDAAKDVAHALALFGRGLEEMRTVLGSKRFYLLGPHSPARGAILHEVQLRANDWAAQQMGWMHANRGRQSTLFRSRTSAATCASNAFGSRNPLQM